MASFSPSGRFSASDVPWVEKHRPIYLKDIVGNEAAISRIKSIARDENMPNLILSGPPGTGKTTSILALAHELLGPNYKEAVLELDASDDRGIGAVLDEIAMFAQKKVTISPGRFKIVILDKVDRVTVGAQEALSRTMEEYSNSARFALTCYISRDISKPIQSRCTLVQFSRLSDEEISDCLAVVIVKEKVPTDRELEGPKVIVAIGCGDMRRALNILQATLSGFHVVNEENVFKAYEQHRSQHVKSMTRGETRGVSDEVLGELYLLTEGFMRGSSIWNNGALLQRLICSQISSQDRERTNALLQPYCRIMLVLKEFQMHIEQLECDEVRLGKERDEANERAAKLAIERDEANERAAKLAVENEEVNQHILNERIITRRWKDRFLNKQNMMGKFKVRLLSETSKWKVRFLNEQKMTKRWKVRFADVKVERRKKARNAKKQLKLLEQKVSGMEMVQAAKEKAELQRKVAELEMIQVAKENAELQRKVSELELIQAAKEKAELQLKVAELEKAQAVIENAKLQQKVAELESIQTAAEQLLSLEPPPLQ